MRKKNPMNRRRFLHTAGIGAFGLSLPALLRMEALARAEGRGPGRAKSLIFLFLYGGPSQIDVWDMKPQAPVEFRGEFEPIQTTVPGLQICEHLPRMAQMARHYSMIRTLYHVNRNHQPAGCWMLTGVNPGSDNAGQLRVRPDDPPGIGSLALKLSPPANSAVPPYVMMPARTNDQGSDVRGQTGGWLGSSADPLHILQDPSAADFHVDGFDQQPDLTRARMTSRQSLLATLDTSPLSRETNTQSMGQFQQQAFDLLASSGGQSAFNLEAEPPRLRDCYGRNMFGQSCLLARRLIEAGCRIVTVFDCTTVGHHMWDTHQRNFTLLRNELLPKLDRAYTALLEDLITRGLLDDTVVYLGGEFGRTPRVGQGGFSGAGASADGRDHYPNCFPGIITGGRVRQGIVYGQSDSKAAYPTRDPVPPEDLAATLLAAMGLDPHGTVYTPDRRPMPATHGRAIEALLS
jgi:hypothetical protein